MEMMDFSKVPTPSYVVDERLLIKNLETLKSVMDRTGCKILLAQKAFSMYYFYPLIGKYLCGTTASGLNEAMLGAEEMGKEVHVFNPAYDAKEFEKLVTICDHIVFNTVSQYEKYKKTVEESGRKIGCGIRVNPEYSEVEVELYNPCSESSRFGVTADKLKNADLTGIEGMHFHTMCEQNSDVLERTLRVVEEKFAWLMKKPEIKWVNFGGGHHITRPGYDIETLVSCINHIKQTYDVQVYLEPGEAIALNTGFLVAKVLDFNDNGKKSVILNTSAACHMPDVLEMPYRPEIIGAGLPGEKEFTYVLGGPTCLSGDIIGEYSFDHALEEGERLVFCDMAHYSMVKNNTFNGINLPSICAYTKEGNLKVLRQFGYEDFKNRL